MNGGDGGNERIVRARSSGGIVLNGDWRRSSSRGQHPRQGRHGVSLDEGAKIKATLAHRHTTAVEARRLAAVELVLNVISTHIK